MRTIYEENSCSSFSKQKLDFDAVFGEPTNEYSVQNDRTSRLLSSSNTPSSALNDASRDNYRSSLVENIVSYDSKLSDVHDRMMNLQCSINDNTVDADDSSPPSSSSASNRSRDNNNNNNNKWNDSTRAVIAPSSASLSSPSTSLFRRKKKKNESKSTEGSSNKSDNSNKKKIEVYSCVSKKSKRLAKEIQEMKEFTEEALRRQEQIWIHKRFPTVDAAREADVDNDDDDSKTGNTATANVPVDRFTCVSRQSQQLKEEMSRMKNLSLIQEIRSERGWNIVDRAHQKQEVKQKTEKSENLIKTRRMRPNSMHENNMKKQQHTTRRTPYDFMNDGGSTNPSPVSIRNYKTL